MDRELPAVLVALTFITGLVDAVTHLALGRVFAANMTGSILVLGFALASLLLGAAAGAALLQRGPTAVLLLAATISLAVTASYGVARPWRLAGNRRLPTSVRDDPTTPRAHGEGSASGRSPGSSPRRWSDSR